MSVVQSGAIQAHAIRIHSGKDLMSSLLDAASIAMKNSGSKSAFVMTSVGSLETVTLRMANTGKCSDESEKSINEIKEWNERLEIVSLGGTFSADGHHLHMSVSNKEGCVFGGHLMAGKIFTTLELVLGTIGDVAFTRENDAATGFDELVVRPVHPP